MADVKDLMQGTQPDNAGMGQGMSSGSLYAQSQPMPQQSILGGMSQPTQQFQSSIPMTPTSTPLQGQGITPQEQQQIDAAQQRFTQEVKPGGITQQEQQGVDTAIQELTQLAEQTDLGEISKYKTYQEFIDAQQTQQPEQAQQPEQETGSEYTTKFTKLSPELGFENGGVVNFYKNSEKITFAKVDYKEDGLHIYDIGNLGNLKGTGEGTEFLKKLEQDALSNGNTKVYANDVLKESIPYWEKQGYTAVNPNEEYPTMVKDLTIQQPEQPEQVTTIDTLKASDNEAQRKTVENMLQRKAEGRDRDVEFVPVDELLKFRQFDRSKTIKALHPGMKSDNSRINELREDIAKNGIKEPLLLNYGAKDRIATLGEGNHRLMIAKELGINYIPVAVHGTQSKAEDLKFHNQGYGAVTGREPDRFGYVPSDQKPSEIGIQSIPYDVKKVKGEKK